jgi:tetratricopeptide (TPR) repeat protein
MNAAMAENRSQTGAPAPRGRWSGRRTWWVVAGAVVLAGGALALWSVFTEPHPAWMVRWQLGRHLKQHAGSGGFRVDFPFPSKAEMAKAPPKTAPVEGPAKGTRTGKDFETLREEYFRLKTAALTLERNPARQAEWQAAEASLAPIVSDLWDFQRVWLAEAEAAGLSSSNQLARARAQFTVEMRRKLDEAGSYAEIYRVIGQELWVAGRLLASANPDHRRTGLSLVFNACRHAAGDAQDGWAAARICEGYALPHLDMADAADRRSPFNAENLLNECADVFRRADEFQNAARVYELALARAKSPQRSDWARAQLVMAYEQAGEPRRALQHLRQIRDTNDFRWVLRRLPRLEQQAK